MMRSRVALAAASAVLFALAPALGAPDGPAAEAPEDELVAIRAGRVITVTGEEHAPGVIIIRDGKIDTVGPRVEIPARARVIDARDQVVMPGLVSARTRLGLARYERTGNHARLSARPELLPEEGRFDAALEGGFVALGVVPGGGGIAGQAVVARPLDEAPLLQGGYLRVRMSSLPDDKRTLRDAFRAAQGAIDKETQARAEWEKKQQPATPAPQGAQAAPVSTATFTPPEIAEDLRPFVAWLRKAPDAPRLLVELGRATDWVHHREVATRYPHAPRYFLSNGPQTDLQRVAAEVGAEKALVLLFPRVSFEANTRTRVHLPRDLARAGARVAFATLTDDEAGYRRHLEAVALACRDGLPRDVALRALTLHPAELLGLEAELGAIEKGRRADLVLLDGDPLEVGTRVTQVLLDGRVAWRREEER